MKIILVGVLITAVGCVDSGSSATDPSGSGEVNYGSPTSRIAFTSNRSNTNKIYTANGDGTGVTALTNGQQPAWSYDGTKIAFWNASSVYKMNRDGTGITLLHTGQDPSWSPDGTQLLYTDSVGINRMNADGTGSTLILSHAYCEFDGVGSCGRPTYSPDGTKIAFMKYNYNPDDDSWMIHVMNADGSNPHALPQWIADYPTWSPDGSRILFAYMGQVVSVLADGTQGIVYVNTTGYTYEPDWSPNGQDVAYEYQSSSRARHRIWTKPGSSAAYQLIPNAVKPPNKDYDDIQPVWSRSPM